ncbi:MAG: hypothetical protein AUI36_21730 [Cyanobacteria bacterium 13_1_40CM_2_61_4]|nr:MAG: hypothetical protein AUI36_21730 [Cyanobacteria bacterium 13_1_40CM_2_61_4]
MGSVTYNIPSGPTVLPKPIALNVVNKVAVGAGGDLGAALAVPMLMAGRRMHRNAAPRSAAA